jgi:hypothetical protein
MFTYVSLPSHASSHKLSGIRFNVTVSNFIFCEYRSTSDSNSEFVKSRWCFKVLPFSTHAINMNEATIEGETFIVSPLY